MGIDPTAPSLATRRSTIELHLQYRPWSTHTDFPTELLRSWWDKMAGSRTPSSSVVLIPRRPGGSPSRSPIKLSSKGHHLFPGWDDSTNAGPDVSCSGRQC